MSFYKQIAPFIDYVHSIRKLKNYLSFDMVFPTKWSLPKSLVEEGQIVGFETEGPDSKGISFVADTTDSSVNEILSKIGKVITRPWGYQNIFRHLLILLVCLFFDKWNLLFFVALVKNQNLNLPSHHIPLICIHLHR